MRPCSRAHAPARAADADAPVRVVLWADRDDDDADGRPDGEQSTSFRPRRTSISSRSTSGSLGAVLQVVSGGEHARICLGAGRTAALGPRRARARLAPGAFARVGSRSCAKAAGRRARLTLDVRGIDLRDGAGEVVDMARSHASLERTPPARIEGPPDAPYDDPDALRVVLARPGRRSRASTASARSRSSR